MAKYFEKDGVTFEVNSVLEEARLKKAGYKEVKAETLKVEAPKVEDETPAESNEKAVEKVNKKKGGE